MKKINQNPSSKEYNMIVENGGLIVEVSKKMYRTLRFTNSKITYGDWRALLGWGNFNDGVFHLEKNDIKKLTQ